MLFLVLLTIYIFRVAYDNNGERYAESFKLDKTPYWLDLEFIPDINKKGKSYKLDCPGINLVVYKTVGKENNRIYAGILPLGRTATFDRNAELKFVGFYPWVMLNAKMEPGLYVIYAGFVVSLIGLAFLYLWVPECISLEFIRTGHLPKVIIGGYKPRYKNEFRAYCEGLYKKFEQWWEREAGL